MSDEQNKKNNILDKTVPLDKTTAIDKTVEIDSSGKNPANRLSGQTARLKSLMNTTSRLNLISGLLGARTVDISDIVSGNGGNDEDEVRGRENFINENFVDFESNFQITETIADGGQGRISCAVDKKLQRIVAVKSLHDKLKEHSSSRKTFIAEGRVTGQLDHPAIISVHGIYGDSSHGLHLAMKHVKGNTLKRYLEKIISLYRHLPKFQVRWNERKMLPQRLDIFLRVCEAVSYAHHKKVIHRDLKPENIMIGSFNETYVMDWGIAEHQTQKSRLKEDDKLAGTVQYIAPEIINREPYDSRSDIYALGLILYEITFLKQAYHSASLEDAIAKAQNCQVGTYEHLFRCPVDRDLKMIIRKALAPIPSGRYQNVKVMIKDIRNYLQFEEVSANPDHLFGKITRYCRIHYKLMLFSFTFLLLSCMTAAFCFLYYEIEDRIMQQKQETAMADIYSKGIQSGTQFDHKLHSLKNLLASIASETALLMETHDTHPAGKFKFYNYEDGKNEKTAPPGFEKSSTYQQKISLETFLYTLPSKEKIPDLESTLRKLYPLTNSFFRILSLSLAEITLVPSEKNRAKEMIRNEVRPPFTWLYVSLKSGLHLAYPYHNDYSDGYDPRLRTWYENTVNAAKNQIVWNEPYLDGGKQQEPVMTCSKAILDSSDQLVGVVCADIPLSRLAEMLAKTGNTGPAVKNKYLVNENGLILVDSASTQFKNAEGKLELKEFFSSELLKTMWSRRNGRIFVVENEIRYLYFFLGIETTNWLYIERINFDQQIHLNQIRIRPGNGDFR